MPSRTETTITARNLGAAVTVEIDIDHISADLDRAEQLVRATVERALLSALAALRDPNSPGSSP